MLLILLYISASYNSFFLLTCCYTFPGSWFILLHSYITIGCYICHLLLSDTFLCLLVLQSTLHWRRLLDSGQNVYSLEEYSWLEWLAINWDAFASYAAHPLSGCSTATGKHEHAPSIPQWYRHEELFLKSNHGPPCPRPQSTCCGIHGQGPVL